MEETRSKVPIVNYDELFCTTVKEDNKVINKTVDDSINYLLDIYCRQYPNDKELGTFIRKHYQRNTKE